MAILAIIPSDPLLEYVKKGISKKLEQYFNPKYYFNKVYLLSPLEHKQKKLFGLDIIPTKDAELRSHLKSLNVDIVRVYGGGWNCKMACRN